MLIPNTPLLQGNCARKGALSLAASSYDEGAVHGYAGQTLEGFRVVQEAGVSFRAMFEVWSL